MAIVDRLGIGVDDDVIDVGCGASHLADRLVQRGVRRLHLLDVSAAALDQVRGRLDPVDSATEVHDHPIDVLELDPVPSVSLWHDRAVLHFLDDAAWREQCQWWEWGRRTHAYGQAVTTEIRWWRGGQPRGWAHRT